MIYSTFKNLIPLLISVMAMVGVHTEAKADMANPNLRKTVTLENGETVTMRLVGDEYGHFWQDVKTEVVYALNKETGKWHKSNENGQIILKKASQRRANAYATQTRKGKVNKSTLTGDRKIPVILVEFPDKRFKPEYDIQWFDNLLNRDNYKTELFNGSVRDYFRSQSNGKLNLTFEIFGPVTTKREASYYGHKEWSHVNELVTDACMDLADNIDFMKYDWNNDNFVEQVLVIFAGSSYSTGGGDDDIWSHKGSIPELFLNGYIISDYAIVSEMFNDKYPCGIGSFCHELSHCFGLPDTYDQTTGNYGMKDWDMMAEGCHIENGFSPAGYTAFDKYHIGWQDPIILSEDTDVKGMVALSEGGDFYMIKNDYNDNEYFLLENRQKTGCDLHLRGHGLLITHIDYDKHLFDLNVVNRTGIEGNDHERVAVVLADNDTTISRYTDEFIIDYQGDLYPSIYIGNDSFTDTSLPAATLHNPNINGEYLLSKPVTSIREENGLISFSFRNEMQNYKNHVLRQDHEALRFNSTSSVSYNATVKNVGYSAYDRDIIARAFKKADGEWKEVSSDSQNVKLNPSEQTEIEFNFDNIESNENFLICLYNYEKAGSSNLIEFNASEFGNDDINKFNLSVNSYEQIAVSESKAIVIMEIENDSYKAVEHGFGLYIYKPGESNPSAHAFIGEPIPPYSKKIFTFELNDLEKDVPYHANLYACKLRPDGNYWTMVGERNLCLITDEKIAASQEKAKSQINVNSFDYVVTSESKVIATLEIENGSYQEIEHGIGLYFYKPEESDASTYAFIETQIKPFSKKTLSFVVEKLEKDIPYRASSFVCQLFPDGDYWTKIGQNTCAITDEKIAESAAKAIADININSFDYKVTSESKIIATMKISNDSFLDIKNGISLYLYKHVESEPVAHSFMGEEIPTHSVKTLSFELENLEKDINYHAVAFVCQLIPGGDYWIKSGIAIIA